MARVKISEYRAKRLLIGKSYNGIPVRTGSVANIPSGKFVVKVDQGIKKRFKQGLAAVNLSGDEALAKTKEWEKKDFSQFIIEPMFPHEASEEQYISFERIREGVRILYCRDGGVDIEAHPELVKKAIVTNESELETFAKENALPVAALGQVSEAFQKYHMCFLEINPLVVRQVPFEALAKEGSAQDPLAGVHILDAACLVDSAAEFFVKSAWDDSDVVKEKVKHESEARVTALAATTPAALKLNVLNKDGSLFFLLSGGGGSIVIADEVASRGLAHMIGNYGEYSGGPTREETYLYSKEILSLMLDSKSKRKALVIAGGVANFTDIKSTFAGIIDALTEVAEDMRKQSIKVFVRRGGPREAAGLSHMKTFLEKENLLGSVYGSETLITQAVSDALETL